MKQVKFKCSKCGYAQVIPDKTESVLCGNCGTWNRPRSLFAGLEQAAPEEKSEGSILQKVPGSIHSEIPDAFPGHEKDNLPEPEESPRSKPGLFSLITILFVAAPVISIIVKKLELPPATTFIIITIAFILLNRMKKRS
ncbi:MAG TPA: hypothetical protein PK986_02545 [Spirochaetota bacterium]|nr:hypothetical protein [Spirochaetota bacterium]HQO39325.1 hypothetical protein [Spirochaetota bacterium]